MVFGSLRRVTCVAPADNARTLQNMHQAKFATYNALHCNASSEQRHKQKGFEFLVCHILLDALYRVTEAPLNQGDKGRQEEKTQEDRSAELEIISGSILLSSRHPVISSRELCFAVIANVISPL